MMKKETRIKGGLFGLVVGDALGVPVEFVARHRLKEKPVTDMLGHGTHNQPAGTWSDDSSMALITLESLLDGYSLEKMMLGFNRWLSMAYMTPHDVVFDVGNTTRHAIYDYRPGKAPLECGLNDPYSNGNGSLMRILPLSIYLAEQTPNNIILRSGEVSSLTHAHIRSRLCCGYYSLLISQLLNGQSWNEAIQFANQTISKWIPPEEEGHFKRVLTTEILHAKEKDIKSTGYVIDTLEAALWCCHTTDSWSQAVLKAVNLGGDTDTIGAVTGGLAGIIYGYDNIPQRWIYKLARLEMISSLIEKFIKKVSCQGAES